MPLSPPVLVLLVLCGAWIGLPDVARADPKDYAFHLVDEAVKVGPATILSVQLIDKKTGRPVPGAAISATALDMAPDAMEDMTTTIVAEPGGIADVQRFKADVSMAGGWRLSLAAKVRGESAPVDGTVIFKARK